MMESHAEPPPRGSVLAYALPAALLFAAVLAVYGITAKAPALYDDQVYLLSAASKEAARPPLGTLAPLIFSRSYLPLTGERSYQPLVTLFHLAAAGNLPLCRWAGLALHSLNATLVFLVGLSLLGDPRRAFLAGLLFALYPPLSEAVDISAFKGHPLSFLFILSAFLLWRKARLDRRPWPRFASLAAFALACLSKETALVLPLLLAAHDFFFKDADHLPSTKTAADKGAWAGLLALTGAYLVWRFGLLHPHPDPLQPVRGAALSLESLGWYAGRLFWPSPLCLETTLVPFSGAWPLRWLLAGAALAATACSLRRPLRAFFSLWILLGLLPVLHLIPFANHSPVADRYLYLPAAGFCLLLAQEARLKPAGLALLGLVWGAALVTRNLLFLDERAFLEQTASCAPANPRAQALLGAFQAERLGDLRGAAASFGRAYSLAPELRTLFVEPGLIHSAGSAYVLGLLNLRMGEPAEAERILSGGLRQEEETSAARAALLLRRGDSRRALGKSEEASCDYQRALALVPGWDLARARARASAPRPCIAP